MRMLLILGTLWFSIPVYADPDGEREALARLSHELDALSPLILEAQSQGSSDAEVKFQYAWLREDVQKIQAGIHEHLTQSRQQPRSFPPLKGDYRSR